jgi:hypothetical protein
MSHNRKSTMVRLVIAVLLFFMMFATPQPARACSCAPSGSPSMGVSQSDAVFSGKVTNITDNNNVITSFFAKIVLKMGVKQYIAYKERFGGHKITFAVKDSWKLVDTTAIQVNTGYGGADCGYEFSVGNDYLIYASHAYGKPGNYLVTSICSRTTDMASATGDLAFLKTMPTIPLTQAPPSWGSILVIAIPVILIFLVVLILFAWRRKQTPST